MIIILSFQFIKLFDLEETRERKLPEVVTYIQTAWRGYAARKGWLLRKSAVKIQAQWRGHKKRTEWERRKACIKLQLWYRRQRSNRYIKNLIKAFGDVKKDEKLGKNIVWPTPPAVLNRGVEMMKKIFIYWRAETMIQSLKTQENKLAMRQKILTYDIFHGKKYWK